MRLRSRFRGKMEWMKKAKEEDVDVVFSAWHEVFAA